VTFQRKVYVFGYDLIQQIAFFLCGTVWLRNYNEV